VKNSMKAAVINRFGGPEELVIQPVGVPEIGPHDVLIQVEYAGVGEWDIFEREGGYAKMLGIPANFPYVLGSEGAGIVAALGTQVSGLQIGDKVYAAGFLNPKGGFYAEYVSVDSKYVTKVPNQITLKEAAVISGVGITALRGLEDILKLKKGESIMIFGASGGVGHIAVQLARVMGARVFAVASGEDGVELCKKLGCDAVIDGRRVDIACAANEFAPEGIDVALFTAGGASANQAVKSIRVEGRLAYPNGIYPLLDIPGEIKSFGYNGDPDTEIIDRLNKHLVAKNLKVHVSQTFLLEDARDAHFALNHHYLGKLCMQVNRGGL